MMLPKRTRSADHPSNGPLIMRSRLIADGLNDRGIRRKVVRGELVRVREGAFTDPDVWQRLDREGQHRLRARAVLSQAKAPLLLSHSTGLCEWDVPMWGLELGRVHATRTDGLTGRRGPDVTVHRGRLHAGDLQIVNDVPTMHPARLALETITLGRSEAAFCALCDVLHRELATPAEVDQAYAAMQTWPDTLAAQVIVRLADPRIETVGERRTFWCCHQQGLPLPVPQVKIRDANGRVVARVDFAWPTYGVFLEFDGRIKYEKLLEPGQRASDVVEAEKNREALVCRLTGWRCIRVTWDELANPGRLAARIRAELFRAVA